MRFAWGKRSLVARCARPLGLAAGVLLVAAGPAHGHAAFVGSEPAPGVRLEASPQRIVLSFTEPLNRGLSRATIAAAGERGSIAVDVQAVGERRLALRPRASLDTGAYVVRWHTVSTEDGHALEGIFSFGVRAPAAGVEHELQQSPLARAGWIRVGLRGLLYVAVLLFAAGVLLPLLLPACKPSWLAPAAVERFGDQAIAIRSRERSLVVDLGWLSVGAAGGAILAEAADAAGGLSADGLRDFMLTNTSGAARLLLLAALVLAVATAGRAGRLSAVSVVVALGAIAASGHASSASPRAISVANDWLHLVSGAAWLGGIGLLTLVWAPALRRGEPDLRRAIARHVLPAFGRVALPAFALVVATGVVSLLIQLGHLEALWQTAYGRVLLVKIVLVGVIAAISALHALRLRPQLIAAGNRPLERVERRHWRLLRSEPLVGLAVVAAVGLLVTFPLPPRQLAEADEAIATAPACDPCPLPVAQPDELPVAEQAGSQLVAAWLRRDGGRLTGSVRVLDARGRPSAAAFEVLDAHQRPCGAGCRRFDRPAAPTLRVAVRDRGRRYVAEVPAVWSRTGAARRLLERAQRTMRTLRGVTEVEEVTSGPGSYARTRYTLQAPDRMEFITNRRAHTIIIGERQWFRSVDTPWHAQRYGSGLPFSTRTWFRWTTYARAVRVLQRRRERGRPVTELALMDPATPVWLRLVIDDRTGRVMRERMIARAHFMHSRYGDFDQRLSIRPPHVR